MEQEIWKTAQYIFEDGSILVFPNYEVSDRGRVRSWMNVGPNKSRRLEPRIMKQASQLDGYLFIGFRLNNKHINIKVHRLVLSTFNPEGYFCSAEIDHIDRNVSNNNIDNLRWTTRNINLSNRPSGPVHQIKVTWLEDGHYKIFSSMLEVSAFFGKGRMWCANIIRECNGFNRKCNIKIEKLA